MFNVYIGFDQSGYGQMFAKKPKFIERDNFFLSMNDAKLLPCLVEDYTEWSNKRRMVLFSPGQTTVEMKGESKSVMECSDFKKDDIFAGNIIVKEVFTMPDPINDGEKFIITCRDDEGHDFVWTTKSKNFPAQNERKYMRAKILGNCASYEFGIPAFAVTSCNFIKEKK